MIVSVPSKAFASIIAARKLHLLFTSAHIVTAANNNFPNFWMRLIVAGNKMKPKLTFPFLVLALAVCASAQSPLFDAVSIRPNITAGGGSSMQATPGRLTMTHVNLRKVILNAYG